MDEVARRSTALPFSPEGSESELQGPPPPWDDWLSDVLPTEPQEFGTSLSVLSQDSLVSPSWEPALREAACAVGKRSAGEAQIALSAIEQMLARLAEEFPTPLLLCLMIEAFLAGAFYLVFWLALTGAVTALPALPAFAVAFGFSGLAIVNAGLVRRWWSRRWLRFAAR